MQTAELIHYEPLSGVLEKEMSGLLTVAKGRVFASGEETSFIMDVSEAAFPNPSMNPLKSSIVYFVARRGNCLSATACVNLTSSSFCTLCCSLFRKQVNVCTSYHSTLCGMTSSSSSSSPHEQYEPHESHESHDMLRVICITISSNEVPSFSKHYVR